MKAANDLAAEDLFTGMTASFERTITEEDILAFARLSGDANPLHIDKAYASTTNHGKRIVHGAFLTSLASAMIGMHLPGKRTLLGSITSHFSSPLAYPCTVHVRGELTSWNPAAQSGKVTVAIQDVADKTPVATIHMGITLHEPLKKKRIDTPSQKPTARQQGRKSLLITGGSGGIGQQIAVQFSQKYDIIALSRSGKAIAGCTGIAADLNDDWETPLIEALSGKPLYGIIHAAWPGMPKGGLLDAPSSTLDNQLLFGGPLLVKLARILSVRAPKEGGRLISLSSIVGSFKPTINSSCYSLGKATLDATTKLLAPELALKNITINAISPTFIPAGINQAADNRRKLVEKATIPMGRLCSIEDVTGLVNYLLSPEASFVSGQIIALSGAQI